MKKLLSYIADVGSLVINGVYFNNNVGDGEFDVYFLNNPKPGLKKIEGVWIDLRNNNTITINQYDCDNFTTPKYNRYTFTRQDLNCQALELYRDDEGNIYFIKYF